MEKEKSLVAKAVRELRQALGESQEAFARRLHVTVRTVARWETIRPPKAYATLSALAHLAVKNHRYNLIRTLLPLPAMSIMVDVLKASPELCSALLVDPELSVLFDAFANESPRESEPRYAEICNRIDERIVELTTKESQRKVWKEAIMGVLQLLDGPRRLEAIKALDIFAAQIDAIQRDLHAGSISAENTQDPGKVKPPEGVK